MERNYSIDLLRIISAVAVVIIHVVTGPANSYGAELDANLVTNLETVHIMMKWSVPVFFIITGYCILNKKEYTYTDCFKHIWKFILVLLTIGFSYALLEEISINKTIGLSGIMRAFKNVISGNLWDHMWYVYDIIGIYLVLPVLHLFMASGKKNRFIITGLLFFFTIIAVSISPWIAIGVNIPFGGYLFYVCFGGMVAKRDFGKGMSFGIVLLGIVSAVLVLFYPDKGRLDYRNFTICLMALSIFMLISNIHIKSSKFITAVSACTWGVYLIHPFFINVATKILKVNLFSDTPYLRLTLFLLVICILSFVATYICRKIPLVRRML